MIRHLFRMKFLVFLPVLSRHTALASLLGLGFCGFLVLDFLDDLSGIVVPFFDRFWSRRALVVVAEVIVFAAVAVVTT